MTKEELTWKMRSISESEFKGDVENRHKAADKLIIQWLRENGCVEAAEIFDSMEKWYA
jgi:hypothetical protein